MTTCTPMERAHLTAIDGIRTQREIGAESSMYGYIIIDVPAIGPNGGHYAPGLRVFPDRPQAPGGMMAPGELPPRPGGRQSRHGWLADADRCRRVAQTIAHVYRKLGQETFRKGLTHSAESDRLQGQRGTIPTEKGYKNMGWEHDETWEDSGEMSGDPIAGEWVGPCITAYYVNGDLRASYSVSVAHGPELNQPDQPLGYWVEDMTHTWRVENDEPVDDEYEYGDGSYLFYGTAEEATREARAMIARDRSIMADTVYADV